MKSSQAKREVRFTGLLLLPMLIVIMLMSSVSLYAAFTVPWTDSAENLAEMGAKSVENEYTIARLSVRGGLYFPAEKVLISLVRPLLPKQSAEGGVIEAVAFNTAQFDPTETGFVYADKARRIARTTAVAVVQTPLSKFAVEGDEWKGEVNLPDAFGMYALVLKRADDSRTILGGIARVPKPQPRVGQYRQIMAEWGLPGGWIWSPIHGPAAVAPALARAGIGLVRKEIQSGISKAGDEKDNAGSDLDSFFAASRAADIQVMITAGCHQDEPLKNAGASMTRQLPPSYDPMLTQWYTNFARRHWTGGKSGLWGMELMNEPWEPEGISGWNSDSQRYRQILKCLHDGVKSVDQQIKVLGTCSVMNTEDKILSGDSREYMKMIDVMTDHYVSIFAAYGPRVAQSQGVISGETETWGAHSQVLAVQFMTQFLSNGQKFINPCTTDMLWLSAPGLDRDVTPRAGDDGEKPGVITPMPTIVAVAAWNALIQDREFTRMPFPGNLPYLYQFGKDDDARLVLYGKVTSTGSGRMRDYPWWQVLQGPNGTLTLADPAKVIEVRDANGNPVARQKDGGYLLPLDTSAFYLWSAKGATTVIDAVRGGTMQGMRAVHIAPNGLTGNTGAGQIKTLPVALHNTANREVSGTLEISSLEKANETLFSKLINIATGSDVTVQVPITTATTNALPLRFTFTPTTIGLLPTEWTEVVQSTMINHATPGKDAKAWDILPGATVLRPQGEVKGSEIEAIWLPFIKKQQATIPTRRGEVKLAWDEKALHVLATVDAKGIQPRNRLATRDDNDFFWSQKYAESQFGLLRPFLKFLATNPEGKIWGGQWWITATEFPGWDGYQAFLTENPEYKKRVANGSAKTWADSLAAGKNLDEFNYAYLPGGAGMMEQLPFSGDSFQFAIDVDSASEMMTATHDLSYPKDQIPDRWTAVPDSDYEFALYQCTDGQPELWCLLAPGVPRGHYFPRQERGKVNQHAVKAECSVENKDGKTNYRVSIPWSELGGKPWKAGSNVGVTFSFKAADGGSIGFGDQAGATKSNSLTLHPYWEPKSSNSIRWTVMP